MRATRCVGGHDEARPLSAKGRDQVDRLGGTSPGWASTPTRSSPHPRSAPRRPPRWSPRRFGIRPVVDDRLAGDALARRPRWDPDRCRRPVHARPGRPRSGLQRDLVVQLSGALGSDAQGSIARIEADRPFEPGQATRRWLSRRCSEAGPLGSVRSAGTGRHDVGTARRRAMRRERQSDRIRRDPAPAVVVEPVQTQVRDVDQVGPAARTRSAATRDDPRSPHHPVAARRGDPTPSIGDPSASESGTQDRQVVRGVVDGREPTPVAVRGHGQPGRTDRVGDGPAGDTTSRSRSPVRPAQRDCSSRTAGHPPRFANTGRERCRRPSAGARRRRPGAAR